MKSKKQCFFLFILITLLPFSLKAKSSTFLKIGTNISSFRMERGKSEPGICFGIGKEYYPIRSFNGFFSLDVSYIKKKIKLEDRTWPSGFFPSSSDVVIGDIKVNISYIEISFNIGYPLQISKDKIFLQLLTGVSEAIPARNHTDGEINEIIYLDPDQRDKYKFDYTRWDEKTTTFSTNLRCGARLIFLPVALSIYYSHAIINTEGFTTLTISDKLDSFQFTIDYFF